MREYTHPDVFTRGVEEGWADPVTDPTTIDWAKPQTDALIPFEVVDGRPVNPAEPDLPAGRNELGHWGEQVAADAIVYAFDDDGRRHLLLIERTDDHGWGVPGGKVDPGEDGIAAAIRELAEETSLRVMRNWDRCQELPPRYVPDPRASREAWMVTVPVVIHWIDGAGLPEVKGGDDAKQARWVPADNFRVVANFVTAELGGTMFAAHREMLVDLLTS